MNRKNTFSRLSFHTTWIQLLPLQTETAQPICRHADTTAGAVVSPPLDTSWGNALVGPDGLPGYLLKHINLNNGSSENNWSTPFLNNCIFGQPKNCLVKLLNLPKNLFVNWLGIFFRHQSVNSSSMWFWFLYKYGISNFTILLWEFLKSPGKNCLIIVQTLFLKRWISSKLNRL